jgi:hypothetical protein
MPPGTAPTRVDDATSSGWPVYLFDFVELVLVECPKCASCATIECPKGLRGTPRLSCPKCAFAKRGWPPPPPAEIRRSARRRCPRCNDWLGEAPARFLPRKRVVEVACPCGAVAVAPLPTASMVLGAPVDPYFRLPLWLRSNIKGEDVWAYNRDHLTFLEMYVRAAIRRRTPNRNASLASRLPRWMKNAHNRDAILKAFNRMASR